MSVVDELTQPISADAPGGSDVSDETDMFLIGQEHDKLSKTLKEITDSDRDQAYKAIEKLATKVLTKDSKDLTVASYLAEAWLHLEGFGGFADGLELIDTLAKEHWDHLFPEDLDGRAVSIDYLGSKVLASIRDAEVTDWGHTLGSVLDTRTQDGNAPQPDPDADPNAPTPENFDTAFGDTTKATYKELVRDIDRCLSSMASLGGTCSERFEGHNYRPSLAELSATLHSARELAGELLDKKLEIEPDTPEEIAAEAEAAPPDSTTDAPPTAAAPAAPAQLSIEPKDSTDAAGRIAASALFLRKDDPKNPAPYLILRAFRWGELKRGGSALDVTLLEAPPTDKRTRLKKLFLDGEWETLLAECEQVMATPFGRGWLDLQRYVSTALQNLGGDYLPVDEAISAQLRLLLIDIPELPQKTLMDDTPTANAETMEWLQRSGLFGDGEGVSAQPAAAATNEQDPEQARREASFHKAQEWAVSGNPRQGVNLLMKRATLESSARARFITQGFAATLMVDHGMASVARPMLEELVQEANTRKLDEWEAGEVVARPLALLYRCLPESDRTRQQLYEQICKLDPVQAFELERMDADPPAPAPAAAPAPVEAHEQSEQPEDSPAVDS